MGPVQWLIFCIVSVALLEDPVTAKCVRTNPPCLPKCHCQSTGTCSVDGCGNGGCQRGWDGPKCQRENIVLDFHNNPGNGILGSSSHYPDKWPSQAFDGNQITYFKTVNTQNPYLWVNIGSVQTVHAIRVVTSEYNFQISVSNIISSPSQKTRCKSINNQYSLVMKQYNLTCTRPLSGQYVWITLTGYGSLDVTEMMIYRCSDYWFGELCDRPCNCMNRDEVCHKVTGHCNSGYGCPEGFDGPNCQDCKDGRYGHDCAICGKCKGGTACSKADGKCKGQCEEGFVWGLCQDCIYGRYGLNCSHLCGNCKDNRACNHTSGYCPGGCNGRYAAGLCQECADGNYGENCLGFCGNCLDSKPCDKVDGKCLYGCDPGFMTDLCNKVCQNNTFGRDCLKTCHCADNSYCDKVSGECGKSACAAPFTGLSCQESTAEGSVDNNHSDLYPAAVGGIVAAALLVIILAAVGLLIFIQRRRRRGTIRNQDGLTNGGFGDPESVPRTSAIYSSPKDYPPACYLNHLELRQSLTLVRADKLARYVNDKIKEDGAMEKEFEELPKDVGKECSEATKEQNRHKCRYRGFLPYDDTRVILDCIDGNPTTDFINASYIDGYSKPKQYIACQGTTKHNIRDFWRMVWQVQAGKIVMLTNLFEKGKEKVLKYWPTDEAVVFGDMSIECTQVEQSFDYCVRTLKVKMGTHVRSLKHFHFTGWLDHNVPYDTAGVIQFREKVSLTPSKLNGPIIIHCSAGVGRTGTYIGYDFLMEKIKTEQEVDIFHRVVELRQQRVMMVQTKDQYEFLHKVLRDAYLCENAKMTSDQLMSVDMDSNEFGERIETEFKEELSLFAVCSNAGILLNLKKGTSLFYYDEFSELRETKTVNFLCEELKSETNEKENDSSEKIWLSIPFSGGSDFIRARFLPLESQSSRLISISVPTEDQVVDFWRLVFEQRCTALVLLNQLTESEEFWPKIASPYSIGFLTISLTDENDIAPYLTTRTFSVEDFRQNSKKTLIVKQFTFTSWKEGPNALSVTDDLLTLKEHVTTWQRLNSSGNILLHCRDGCERSGLYAVCDFLLDGLNSDGYLNVLLTVKRFRGYCSEFIPTIEQYKFCYRVAKAYFQMFETYANFD